MKGAHFDFNLFRSLEVFAAVVETRQVTRAAAMLGMTQSAASQHLKNLETALDTKLVDRSARPIRLTEAGTALHRRAIRILDEVDDLRAEIRRLNAAPLPLLRIAMLASITTTLASPLAALARERFGVPEVSMFAGLASDHLRLLRERRADLAVTSDALFEIEALSRYPILRERYLLVTPKGFAGPLDDPQAMARSLPFIRFTGDTGVGRRIDQHLNRLRLDLPRTLEGDRASIVLAPIAEGMGFSFLTPTLLIDGVAEGMEVDVHPLPVPGVSRDVMLVARERELGDLPAAFAEASAETLAAALDAHLPNLPADSYRITLET